MKTLIFVVALISLAGAQTVEKFGTMRAGLILSPLQSAEWL